MKRSDTTFSGARVPAGAFVILLLAGCGGTGGEADVSAEDAPDVEAPDGWRCSSESDMRCFEGMLFYCVKEGEFLSQRQRDCEAEGLLCIDSPPIGCALCRPDSRKCEENDIYQCSGDGMAWAYLGTCNAARGEVCVEGYCRNGCEDAAQWKSNVGCEYYAVDLDNAVAEEDASAQQYAVVVSNVGSAEATVTVEINEAPLGDAPSLVEVERAVVSPMDLEVFLLDRREVDGSTMTGQNDGTNSALTSNAYRVTSTVPIVAYQFNPLDDVDVFSNDASLLIPSTACGRDYVVLGWPQTISEPYFTNNLRATLTIVGTDFETDVSVTFPLDERLRVVGDGGIIPDMIGGDTFETTLGPFDVLNLETGGFNSDFTGTVITSSKPVVVFSGSEASDVPDFEDLSTRKCCADHLEEQLYPSNRNGRRYVAAPMPPRTAAVKQAGGDATVIDEPEYFKVMGLYADTTVETTLPPPWDVFRLGSGESLVIESTIDFVATADKPVSFGQFVASQNVTGIRRSLPGGDPAFILVPPAEQWRRGYVFLTPALYAFDFIVVLHTPSAGVLFDGQGFPPTCESSPVPGAESQYIATKCQLSFPEIIEGINPQILDGEQNDGVHEITADEPVGLIVYGFDRYVSYGYPGGTDLRIIE